jgi:hypothetical protein
VAKIIFVFLILTFVIALISGAWSSSDRKEKTFVLKMFAKGAFYATIATGILFIFVTLF